MKGVSGESASVQRPASEIELIDDLTRKLAV